MTERDRYPILSVEEAQERVLAHFACLDTEDVPVLAALGRVLAEDIVADMDIPPLANSAMDGYAVHGADIQGATPTSPARLPIVANLAAGYTLERPLALGEAVRIMTGAPVPEGTDTVVRFEDTRTDGDYVEILVVPRIGRNVRAAGEDVRRGSVVVPSGTLVRPQEVGMMASVGRATVTVVRRPRVGILATGDEVAAIDAPLRPGQIRNSNNYSVAALVHQYGGDAVMLGIARDQRDELVARIRQGLDRGVDMLVTSGGVSVGDFDLVKQVLATEGEISFWWVNMKPGKPIAFGAVAGVPLLALPGNPVAAMLSFLLFGTPALHKMSGRSREPLPAVTARLSQPIATKDSRRHYLRVRLIESDEGLQAEPTGDQGSGILTSMVQADGLAIIPENRNDLPTGSAVQVLLLR